MGLLLAQQLRGGGAARVDVVDLRPERLEVARGVGADEVSERPDAMSTSRWDLVVDATGSVGAIEDGLARVARGGTLLLFGVAPPEATARFSPFAIYNEEITVIGSMAVLHSFGRAVEALEAGPWTPAAPLTPSAWTGSKTRSPVRSGTA
jgi:threonine dehydrogenase-like Zn-dependent dehydrogenase